MSQDGITQTAAPPEKTLHFITGATGLFGSEYIYTVLTSSSKTRCAVLIPTKKQRSADVRVNDLAHYLFGSGETYQHMRQRIDAYAGDVRQKKFGLDDAQWAKLTSETNYIFHAAANSKLSDTEDQLNAVNVMGTVTVINFAKRCRALLRFMHVSSAYVSGTETGRIMPDQLNMSSLVSDAYQMSKRIGEQLVRKHCDTLPVVIVRPGTLVGHSSIGRTSSYKAFYYPTRMLVFGHSIIFPYSRSGKIEAIPADWAAKIAFKLMLKQGIESRCFHLTMGERAYTMDQIKRIIFKSLINQGESVRKVRLLPRTFYRFFVAPLISIIYPNGRSVNRDFKLLSNYTCVDRIYDNRDTFRATGEDHNQLPGLEGYYDRLYSYATKNRWKTPKAPDWLHRADT